MKHKKRLYYFHNSIMIQFHCCVMTFKVLVTIVTKRLSLDQIIIKLIPCFKISRKSKHHLIAAAGKVIDKSL
jgi:hypothetical protein